MKIAIIGNGQSALQVNDSDLIDKDLIVRLKLGAVKPLNYNINIIKKEHHVIIHPYNLKKLNDIEANYLFTSYKKIYFISYLYSKNVIKKCNEDEFNKKIFPEINFDISFKNSEFLILNFFNLYENFKDNIKSFNIEFYNHVNKIISTELNDNEDIIPTRSGLFSSFKTLSLFEDVNRLKAFVSKYNNKDYTIYPSIGLSTVLLYLYLYPNSKIYLYGYDFNNDSGWFWSKEHKHNKMTHNFAYEKEFILKNQLFSNVIIE